jgi:hypothetical protein
MRSLEEFRKHPHIQIPSKSPCKIPESPSKIQIHLKFESPGSGPADQTCPHQPTPPSQAMPRPPGLVGPRTLGAPSEYVSLMSGQHRLLSFLSLTSGPHMSALSSSHGAESDYAATDFCCFRPSLLPRSSTLRCRSPLP